MPEISLFGCKFKDWTKQDAISKIQELISLNQRAHLCTVNVSILMMMRSDKKLNKIVHQSEMIVADGQPILWASQYVKTPLPERIAGVDLVKDLASLAQQQNWGIYLLGASQDVVSKVATTYKIKYPNLLIAGYHNGYFDKTEEDNIVDSINQSGAKILIVAMGVPRQEYFISDSWQRLNVNLAIGVGGSFDVISGLIKRAPLWMQNVGLEWFYRMLQEPRRLFVRYFLTNIRFLILSLKKVVFRARR